VSGAAGEAETEAGTPLGLADRRPSSLLWTGIGSWPGTDMADAVKIAFAECPELPYLPELPARGPAAQLVGRGAALMSGLAVDLQPAGWRLADAPNRDARQARSLFRQDLDDLEEVAQGYAGPVKVAVAGPWTLAAALERPRGDRVVADHGARRDVVQSLTDGIGELVGELRRRLPDVALVVQLDEPLLPAVLTGSLSTASGFSRHRSVDRPEVAEAYSALVAHLRGRPSAPPVVVHCCAPGAPVSLLREVGVAGIALDLGQMGTGVWDEVGEGLAEGLWFGAGALPTDGRGPLTRPDAVAARVLARLDDLGLDAEAGLRTVLTPACGLAGFDAARALAALRVLRSAADIVTDRLLG
jgi:methionine synthase II (cobalamin-independent)